MINLLAFRKLAFNQTWLMNHAPAQLHFSMRIIDCGANLVPKTNFITKEPELHDSFR